MRTRQAENAQAARGISQHGSPEEPIFFKATLKPENPLNAVFEIEKPGDCQRAKLIEAVLSIKSELEAKGDDKRMGALEIVEFVNKRLTELFPASEGLGNSVLLKDIVPSKEGEKPVNNIDCDSRVMLIKGVMHEIGRGKEVVPVEMTYRYLEFGINEREAGHMMAYLPESHVFFEALDGTVLKKEELGEDELLKMNALETTEKLKGHILANMAIASQGEEKVRYLEMALALSPDLMGLRKNYITIMSGNAFADIPKETREKIKEQHESIIATLERNYVARIGLPIRIGDAKEMGNAPDPDGQKIEILGKSGIIAGEYLKYANFCLYDAHDFKKAGEIFEMLFKANGKEPLYAYEIMDCHFKGNDYKKFMESYEKLGEFVKRDIKFNQWFRTNHLESQYIVSRILTGKTVLDASTREQFMKEWGKSDLVRGLMEGENWNIENFDAVEALKAWKGYAEFKRVLLNKE